MKPLVMTAGLFVLTCLAGAGWLATRGLGHEYDIKFVLPIDTRQMPKPVEIPGVQGNEAANTVTDANAQAIVTAAAANHKPFRFDTQTGGATPEFRASE